MNKSCHIYGLFQKAMNPKGFLILIFISLAQLAQAQDYSPDYMRSSGKIYVVAGVTIIILVTLLIYMVMIDRKISRLEKRQKNE